MDFTKIKDALQDLIIRLQDAEKGYLEIEKATAHVSMKKWLKKYAAERHDMHRALESEVALMGGDADVKTSFLGDLHRMFIDIKINNTNYDSEFDAIVSEIERGASTLVSDYDNILDNLELPDILRKVLYNQKTTIESEVSALVALKEELNAVEA